MDFPNQTLRSYNSTHIVHRLGQLVGGYGLQQLWSYVIRCSHWRQTQHMAIAIQGSGITEISQFNMAKTINQYIFRLYIPMHIAHLMQCVQGHCELGQIETSQVLIERAVA